MTSSSDVNNQQNGLVKGVCELLSLANAANKTEVLSIFLHACMLDVGFLPVSIKANEIYKQLPKDWKSNGALKFHYYHKTCLESLCWMTCIPLYSFVAVHGALHEGSPDIVYIQIKTTDYLNSESNLFDYENLFVKPEQLAQEFKDTFCYPLLALLQKDADCDPTFGFSITVDEVKLFILKLLPIQSICALSSVNKDFNRVANSPFLWKYLLDRDFGLIDVPTTSSEDNYKEVYKREYLKKKQRSRRFAPLADPFHYPHPHIFPSSGPLLYVDPRRDMDPAMQQAFPYLRDRLRPNWILPQYELLSRFM